MKMMKTALSLLLAMVMTMAMTITTFAEPANLSNHTYKAYQIFDGKQAEGSAELGQIIWGSGIDEVDFLQALKDDTSLGATFDACATAADVAEVLGGFSDGSNVALKFAEIAYDHVEGDGISVENGQTTLAAGYYLVVDVTKFDENATDTVYNLALLQLTNKQTFEIETKTDIPSVDKEVLDEVEDAEAGSTDGWGETADHAINENFQFKLTATLPTEINFDAYDTYKVEFVDTMSVGITFVSIDSVIVDGVPVFVDGSYLYRVSTNATAGMVGPKTWTITFPNLKEIIGVDLSNGATIEVVYTAYLNESAMVNHESGTSTTNENGVYLRYSNNPNTDGEGKTKEDYVWIFTYDVENTKYSQEANSANVLAGAGFKLYTDATLTNEVGLIWDANLSAYRPVKSNETKEELISRSEDLLKGTFNIVGLDAGIYYLHESTVPAGYNQCSDIEIVIGATHAEDADETAATTTFTEATKNIKNHIENKKGSLLPETGGMGTTLFYVIGSILVLGAGVMLVTKKRMDN